jgi:lipopolysaccharide biosynthesis regulator YciM
MDCLKCSADVEFHGLDWYCPSCGAYGHVQPWMMRTEDEEDAA